MISLKSPISTCIGTQYHHDNNHVENAESQDLVNERFLQVYEIPDIS